MSKGDDKGASAISVWKRELGPNLSDIFLRKNIDKLRNNNGCTNIEGGDKGQSRCTQRNIIVEGRKKNIYPDFVCRDEFTFDENITCFPNYMHKSSIKIKNKLDICDVIIEVRDARVPFTSTNYFITDNLKKYKNTKKNIILLNKVDLISKELALKAQKLIEEKTNSICLLTSSKYNKNISKIRDICKEIKPKFKAFGLFCMLIGLPNVGKSSIINSFKEITYNLGKYGYKNNKIAYEVNRKKVKTNVLAGTTKLIEQYKVSNNPLLYFIDTPGIYLPKMADKEISLKLSAIGNVLDYKYNDMYVGDYILFTLNKNKNYNYVKMIGLDNPTNDIRFVSNVISTKLNLCRNYKYLDINGGCKFFIDMFRLGLLGQTCLDEIPNKSDFVTYFDFNSSEPIAVDSNLAPVPFRGLT